MVRSRETEMMGLWLKALVEICSYFDFKKKKNIGEYKFYKASEK